MVGWERGCRSDNETRIGTRTATGIMVWGSNSVTGQDWNQYRENGPCRPVPRVHTFGKGEQAMRRDPHIPPTMRGWLHKQDSSGLRLWKRRWFVLVDLCLYYYRDSSEQRVRGGLPLPGYRIRVLAPSTSSPRFLFTVEHPGMRSYVLGADSPEELGAWMCSLRHSASPMGGPIPPRPALPSAPAPEEAPPHGQLRPSVAATNQQLTPPAGGGLRDAKEGTAANQESTPPREPSDWLLASGGTAARAATNEISLWPWEQSIVGSREHEGGREGVANGVGRQPIRITVLHASF
ncbi:pleckstrin homology domain-containing family A member 6-like isoform X1 [Gallus gallus]|uniref:pleckstrin homology domain-containing family A member 6-like isoform X1 n=1 Tax=Gallus gallus TaxID=9031 RepID=UPI001AE2458B|nr:pleckstrin homology domain-containing family A member 6-like isoform X1 [Gallus gallus]